MSAPRPYWPVTLRPFVAYRPPPTRQPTRSESPRDVCADVRRFLNRVAKLYAHTGNSLMITTRRWSTESVRNAPTSYLGEWPSECSMEDFDAAVRLAHQRFGTPTYRPSASNLALAGAEFECHWRVSTDRIDDVLEFLACVPSCTGGEFAPVNASYTCLFLLRDLDSGAVVPMQGSRYHPGQSMLSVELQRSCRASLRLTLPFDAPDDAVANYVVALQEHAPVWLDPRYFDHISPEPDGSRFQRTRLPASWVGVTPTGELRLDASRSGITPMEVDLPSDAEMAGEDVTRDDAPFQVNCAAVALALRRPSVATILIRGAEDAEYMVERAAASLGMPLHLVRTVRASRSLSLEEELRTVVSRLDGRRAVLLLEVVSYVASATNAALLSQMAGRVLLGVALPPEVRLVVSVDGTPGEGALAAATRSDEASTEGFGTRQQLEFLQRQASRAGWREVVIEVLPLPESSR